MTAEPAGIHTPDQRLRVYVSSVLDELASERARVWEAIVSLRLAPVMVELGARSHAARDLYRAYIEQSDIFIGLYGQQYGYVVPALGLSAVEDEYDLCGGKPRLLYVKSPAPGRERRMTALLERIEAEGKGSYRPFSTPDELVELVRDDLAVLLSERFTTPTAPAAAAVTPSLPAASRLPAPTTPLIGRERDVAKVRQLLLQPATRLVTLTGAGGIGKTRLALELGRELHSHYPGGVTYVQLASVRNPALVMPTIATAVGATIERGQPATDAIVSRVQQPLLLIPDNLEQIDGVGPQIAELLTAAPIITVLATSRTALRIRGEHEYQVPVLDVGVAGQAAIDSPTAAVALFAERARAARPGFELTAGNIAAIAEICRRLDGLPLAIELAAARVRLLPPEALLTRLGNRLDTLGTAPSDLPERQRTLRATIDWSFSLLDDATAEVMTMLAVFTDGWTLDAAAEVCGLDEFVALDALDALTRQSLVLISADGDEPRFRMLATVKEYAAERLQARPDVEQIADRHAGYYIRLLQHGYGGLVGQTQSDWGVQLEQEQGNVRAVLRRYLDGGDIDAACDVIRAAWPFWWLRDQLVEANQWIARAMERLDHASPAARAGLLWSAWSTSLQLGDNAGAVRLMEQSLEAVAAVDDPVLEALSLLMSSYTMPITGDLDRAFEASLAALEKFHTVGESFLTGLATSGLGTIAQIRGDMAGARGYHQRAVEIGRSVGNKRLLGQALSSLGMTLLSDGDIDGARVYIEESGEVLEELGSAEGVSLALSAYSMLAVREGEPRRAAVARGAVEDIRRRIGIDVWPVVASAEQQLIEQLRGELGDREYEAALAEGAAQSLHEALVAARGGPRPVNGAAGLPDGLEQ